MVDDLDIGIVRTRSWPTAVLIVVAALLVCLPVPGAGAPFVVAAVLALVTVSAFSLWSPPVIRTALFMDAVFLVFTLGTRLGWSPAVTTVLVCVVPTAILLVCGRAPSLSPAAPWLRAGRLTRDIPWLAAVTIGGGGVALTLWALAVKPSPSPYLRQLQELPVWVAALGVVGFAMVNSVWEEALFRGILLTELRTVAGTRPAVVIQALVFGFAHMNGFPSGWTGMIMSAVWGLMLGVLRVRSRGILVPYVVHVCADATIGILAVTVLL
ncbi:lysostaphin resistance A-like protein [Sphaerisporangium viridialbum]|uniref:CPBP family intramembrane glutamic endopeptidase n=1 Tax=Sphaerisporangium viridialbum TaxID=46189 RepID=UPI003C717DE6